MHKSTKMTPFFLMHLREANMGGGIMDINHEREICQEDNKDLQSKVDVLLECLDVEDIGPSHVFQF